MINSEPIDPHVLQVVRLLDVSKGHFVEACGDDDTDSAAEVLNEYGQLSPYDRRRLRLAAFAFGLLSEEQHKILAKLLGKLFPRETDRFTDFLNGQW